MFTNMEFKPFSTEPTRPDMNTKHEPPACKLLEKTNILESLQKTYLTNDCAYKSFQGGPRKASILKKQNTPSQYCYAERMTQLKKKQQIEQKTSKPVVKASRKEFQSSQNANKIQRQLSINPSTMSNLQRIDRNLEAPRSARNLRICKTKSYSQQTSFTILSKDISLDQEVCFSDNQITKFEEKDERKRELEILEIDVNPVSLEIDSVEYNEVDKYSVVRRRVDEAIRNNRIFLIRADVPYLENVLKRRGWIQKYESTKTRHLPYGNITDLDAPSLGNIHLPDGTLNEKYVIFQSLRHVPPDFIWDCRNNFIDWNGHIKQNTFLNRFERSFIYTSKLGMANILESAHWYTEENVAVVQYPRSYNVARDTTAFVQDYRRTAVVSLLKWFVQQMQGGIDLANKGHSPISPRSIEFAIKRCEEIVSAENDEYLDLPEVSISPEEWEDFVCDYIKAVHEGNGILDFQEFGLLDTERRSLGLLYTMAEEILKKVRDIDPQYELNGTRNIWILKPSNLCCGTGIIMTHDLSHIMKKVQDCTKDYFVVQKYIEKPLLVQDTKFDVRQWYLVTKSYPLTIWIYNSRPFTFENYHEAVHICNTAIQNKYIRYKSSVRSQDLDCDRLNEYLKTLGYKGEPWHEIIYPKLCQAIIATMLAAQEHMDRRKYSFELYGADFMIMEDLSVWLIEINTNPRTHPPSTRVTQRLYPDVLESLIKVIMDYPLNPNADTGNFVLAYEQNVTEFQSYLGPCLTVNGKAIETI